MTEYWVWSSTLYPLHIPDTLPLLMQPEAVPSLAVPPATPDTKCASSQSLVGRNLPSFILWDKRSGDLALRKSEIHSGSGPAHALSNPTAV